jgi:ferritin-like protein
MEKAVEICCVKAFSELCEEARRRDIDTEECSFWVFERGYSSAVQDFIALVAQDKRNAAMMASLQVIADRFVDKQVLKLAA